MHENDLLRGGKSIKKYGQIPPCAAAIEKSKPSPHSIQHLEPQQLPWGQHPSGYTTREGATQHAMKRACWEDGPSTPHKVPCPHSPSPPQVPSLLNDSRPPHHVPTAPVAAFVSSPNALGKSSSVSSSAPARSAAARRRASAATKAAGRWASTSSCGKAGPMQIRCLGTKGWGCSGWRQSGSRT